MEFHVWDFSPDIEVRLTDAFIERVRNMTVKKKILFEDKKARLGHGWKKPHRRRFYMEKEIKLIALYEGTPYHHIAERLYPKLDWHGQGRSLVEHIPFISISECHTLSKVTEIPLTEIERHVIEVRNGSASRHRTPLKLPIEANEDWAWLLGLWYSSGGLISRKRIGKGGYLCEERAIRFRLDQRVFDEKVQPILERICGNREYIPGFHDPWYIRKGIDHPLDKHKRKGLGNVPRKCFYLLRPIREIMEKFGLPKEVSQKNGRKGAKFANRKFHPLIPSWIQIDEKKTYAFIEGYVNGGSAASNFRATFKHGKQRGLYLIRNVEIRFSFFKKEDTDNFYGFFERHMAKLGITAYRHNYLYKQTSTLYWAGFLICSNECISRFFEEFDIRRPDLRARLLVHYFMNSLVYEVCRYLNSSEILMLGALMERSMDEHELADTFRFRLSEVQECLQKLTEQKIAIKACGKWKIIPTGRRKDIVKQLEKLETRRLRRLWKLQTKFFSQCNTCHNIITRAYTGPCACGGKYEQIERHKAIKRLAGHKGYNHLIETIKNQKIPTLS